MNPNPTDHCGCGVNVATLDWVRRHNDEDLPIWKVLVKWEWMVGAVVLRNGRQVPGAEGEAGGDCGDHGGDPVSTLRSPAIAEELGLRRVGDEPFLVNNNLKAALTRLVLMEYPDLPFRPRRSKCDPSSVAV